ncbi:MAG TPA: serine hydrolase [Pyrinomonadaceae bacterium]|jgi:CubicO group peptidase (beta-lactamase class C family)
MSHERRPRRTALLAAFLFLLPALAAAQDLGPKIDEYMQAAVKAERFSGAILVARDGKVVAAKGYGMADLENDVPNTPETKFRLGSITKQFTSASIMLLQERGKLSVRDSVCKYVAPCPEAWQPVTLHHLLSHTAGVPNLTGFPDYQKTKREPASVESVVARFRAMPLDFKPGADWKYSNSGYILLGYVIEKVTGGPYEKFVTESIFEPLKMTSTGYDHADEIIKHRAHGYAPRGERSVNAEYIDMSIPHAAGALYSTVGDLYLWDQALYTDKLLKKQSLDAVYTPVLRDYGYGWNVVKLLNRKAYAHGGGIEGFVTYIVRFPEERATVIVLSNLEGTSASRVGRDLSAIMFGEKYEVPVERAVVKVDPKIYDAYAGEYEVAPGVVLSVTREGDSLMAQPTNQRKLELFPASETNFFSKVVRVEVTFVKDAQGRVTNLVVNQGGRQQTAKKIK